MVGMAVAEPLKAAYRLVPQEKIYRPSPHTADDVVGMGSSTGEADLAERTAANTSPGFPANIEHAKLGDGRQSECPPPSPTGRDHSSERADVERDEDDGAARGCTPEPRAPTVGVIDEASVLMHDGILQPAMCGISHIWVDSERRRSGIARHLLDAARHATMAFHANW